MNIPDWRFHVCKFSSADSVLEVLSDKTLFPTSPPSNLEFKNMIQQCLRPITITNLIFGKLTDYSYFMKSVNVDTCIAQSIIKKLSWDFLNKLGMRNLGLSNKAISFHIKGNYKYKAIKVEYVQSLDWYNVTFYKLNGDHDNTFELEGVFDHEIHQLIEEKIINK